MRVEGLKRFLAPAAVVVLALIAVWMVLDVVAFALLSTESSLRVGSAQPWAPFGAWPALLLASVTGVAVLWGGRAVRALTAAAVVLCGIGLLLQLGAAVVNLSATGDRVEPLGVQVGREFAQLVLPVMALLWLVRLRRAGAGVPKPEAPTLPQKVSDLEPTWQPDQAVGAHWSTAANAATGAAASALGTPGERSGWVPPIPALEAGSPPAGTPGSEPGAPVSDAADPDRRLPAVTGPVHQPRPPTEFGPQALAEQYGAPEQDPDRPEVAPPGSRQPPKWAPLDRGDAG